MKTQIENLDLIEIPGLGIKVEKTLSDKMNCVEVDEYCKRNGARLLTAIEAEYIFNNGLIEDFGKEREWFQPSLEKSKEKFFGYSFFLGSWEVYRLIIRNYDCEDNHRVYRARLTFQLINNN